MHVDYPIGEGSDETVAEDSVPTGRYDQLNTLLQQPARHDRVALGGGTVVPLCEDPHRQATLARELGALAGGPIGRHRGDVEAMVDQVAQVGPPARDQNAELHRVNDTRCVPRCSTTS